MQRRDVFDRRALGGANGYTQLVGDGPKFHAFHAEFLNRPLALG